MGTIFKSEDTGNVLNCITHEVKETQNVPDASWGRKTMTVFQAARIHIYAVLGSSQVLSHLWLPVILTTPPPSL